MLNIVKWQVGQIGNWHGSGESVEGRVGYFPFLISKLACRPQALSSPIVLHSMHIKTWQLYGARTTKVQQDLVLKCLQVLRGWRREAANLFWRLVMRPVNVLVYQRGWQRLNAQHNMPSHACTLTDNVSPPSLFSCWVSRLPFCHHGQMKTYWAPSKGRPVC